MHCNFGLDVLVCIIIYWRFVVLSLLDLFASIELIFVPWVKWKVATFVMIFLEFETAEIVSNFECR